jgi:ornithine cyclodeaminase/alanine dehydrogenase-like protein (mu-crystallin family)
VLATSSTTPVIESDWVEDGAHLISIGACRPSHWEIDPVLVARTRLIVDSRAAALQESGDVILGIRGGCFSEYHIWAELGEIASGLRAGRSSQGEITVFKSLGLAVEDLMAAGLAYRYARESGKSVEVAL